MPGYTQKAAFFHLEIVTMCASLQYYTVLVYVSVLVGVVHLRLFPIFPHVFRCQAHLLDTIYCVHVSHRTYIQCTIVPARCGRRTSGPIASSRSLSVWPRGRARCAVHLLAYVLAALASVLYRLGICYIFNDTSPGLFFTCARCACLCVRLLMPGQRWTFLSVVPVRPALLARVCARCARLRACAWACSLRSPTPVPAPTPTCVPAPVPVCVACLLPLFAPIL